jgi:hypothetical protein
MMRCNITSSLFPLTVNQNKLKDNAFPQSHSPVPSRLVRGIHKFTQRLPAQGCSSSAPSQLFQCGTASWIWWCYSMQLSDPATNAMVLTLVSLSPFISCCYCFGLYATSRCPGRHAFAITQSTIAKVLCDAAAVEAA